MYRRYYGVISPISLIIAINAFIFLMSLIFQNLDYFLGLSYFTLRAQPWDIVTSLFVHASLWHVMANMLTFYFFGQSVSELVGNRALLLVYFGGGILGNIFFLLLAPHGSLVVGASGAVFALGGVLVMMRPKVRVVAFPIPVPMPLWIAVVGGFILVAFFPNVAWQAHLGGLIFGMIAGYFYRRRERGFYRRF